MNVACLFVAGALRFVVPAQEFTLAWTHSVQKTRWEERYRIDGLDLRLAEARIQSSGAGMDPPPDAHFRDGWWTWTPRLDPLHQIRLTLSPYTAGYDLCWHGRCRKLRSLAATRAVTAVVELRPCTDVRSR